MGCESWFSIGFPSTGRQQGVTCRVSGNRWRLCQFERVKAFRSKHSIKEQENVTFVSPHLQETQGRTTKQRNATGWGTCCRKSSTLPKNVVQCFIVGNPQILHPSVFLESKSEMPKASWPIHMRPGFMWSMLHTNLSLSASVYQVCQEKLLKENTPPKPKKQTNLPKIILKKQLKSPSFLF